MFTTEQLVRSEGYAKESMMGLIWGTVANLAMDVLLIAVLHLGVVGAGLAMAIANGVSTAYYLWILKRKSQTISWSLADFTLSADVVKPVVSVGSSELVQSAFMTLSGFLLNFVASAYGSDVVAVFGVAQRFVMFPEMISMGVALGGMSLFAYSVGSRNQERTSGSLHAAALMIIGISVVFSLLVYVFRDQALTLIGGEELVGTGDTIITAMLLSTVFNGLTMLAMVWFQSAGKALPATVMGATQGILLVPVLLGMNAFFGLNGVIWALPLTEVLTFALGAVLFIATGGTKLNAEAAE